MTREETAEAVKVMQAWIDGKKIECRQRGGDKWQNASHPIWDFDSFMYRIKPSEETVPWDCPEDVPMNCWITGKGSNGGPRSLITSCLFYGVHSDGIDIKWKDLFVGYEWTVDGKTWHPCSKKKQEN